MSQESSLENEVEQLVQSPLMPYTSGIDGFTVHSKCPYAADGIRGLIHAIEAIGRYDQRALNVAAPQDLVLITGNTYDKDYVQWLHDVGLGTHPDNVVLLPEDGNIPLADRLLGDDRLLKQVEARVHNHCDAVGMHGTWHPFWYSSKEREVAETLELDYFGSETEKIQKFNDKAYFKEMCRAIGVPVIDGVTVSRKLGDDISVHYLQYANALLEGLAKFCGRVFIRGNISAAGNSKKICTLHGGEDSASFNETLEWMLSDTEMTAFLVERDCSPHKSPSAMFRILSDGTIYRLSPVGRQILLNREHQGNCYPLNGSPHVERELVEMGVRIALEKRKRGYVGDFGIDFIESQSGLLYPVEENPRNTGQSALAHFYVQMLHQETDHIFDDLRFSRRELSLFPDALVQKIYNGDIKPRLHMQTVNVKTSANSFKELHELLGDILYVPGRSWGVVPMNIGPLRYTGKFSLVTFAKSEYDFHGVTLLAAARVGVKNVDVLRQLFL